MKKITFFVMLFLVSCGPSEAEIQDRIDEAVDLAVSEALENYSNTSTTTTTLSTSYICSTLDYATKNLIDGINSFGTAAIQFEYYGKNSKFLKSYELGLKNKDNSLSALSDLPTPSTNTSINNNWYTRYIDSINIGISLYEVTLQFMSSLNSGEMEYKNLENVLWGSIENFADWEEEHLLLPECPK